MSEDPTTTDQSSDNSDRVDDESTLATIEKWRVTAVDAEEATLQDRDGTSMTLPGARLLSPPPCVGDEVRVFVDREDDPPFASQTIAERLETFVEIERAARKREDILGDVVAQTKGGYAVDIGARAFLPAGLATLRPGVPGDDLVGQRLSFAIDTFNPRRMNIVLTRKPILERERAEQATQTLHTISDGEVMLGTVVGFTRYGMFVDIGGLDGLVHQSDLLWGRSADPRDIYALGQKIKVKVLEVKLDDRKVKLGVKQLQEDPWLHVGEHCSVGERVSGEVRSLTHYGAFVEIVPGLEGMIHVSEMSWTDKVNHPRQHVNVGDTVEAVVLECDAENRRLALGLKQATDNPWLSWVERYPVGSRVEGRVASTTEFGVFVELEPGLHGLIHNSDIKWHERVHDPAAHFTKGDVIEAQVLRIDPDTERLSLGIKQLVEDPWIALAKAFPRGTRIQGKVKQIRDFGVFVEVRDGIEGMIHVSELETTRVERPGDVVALGQELEALVIKVDVERRRLALSRRAVDEGLDEDHQDYLADDSAGFANTMADAFERRHPGDK